MTSTQKLPYSAPVELFPPPPAYHEVQHIPLQHTPKRDLDLTTSSISASNIGSLPSFKPIVIPQTSKSFRGAFFSPFCRAYSPLLAASSDPITPEDFMTFIDGLNEAFIAAPAFQIASYLGGAMTFAPDHTIMFAGMGVQAAAGLISAATSWTRARSFVKAANEAVFHPRGLKCTVLKTKKMLAAVHREEEALALPPLELEARDATPAEGGDNDDDDANDPRMRRIRALGDAVAPLTFAGLPEPETMENFWKRTGSRSAQKKDAKMQRKLMKEREKGFRELEKKSGKAEREGRKHDKEIAKVERAQAKEERRFAERLGKSKARDPKERAKIEKEHDKEMRKLGKELGKKVREKEKKVGEETDKAHEKIDKAERKEAKIAQKIYWIVIHRLEDGADAEGGGEDVESLESP